MGFWSNLAKTVIRDVVKPELEAMAKDIGERAAQAGLKAVEAAGMAARALREAEAAVAEVRELRRQMAAAMALDVGFKDAGKVIILTRIGDQDRVKFVDIKPEMTAAEYKTLVERLKDDFGVGDPVWVDKPAGMDDVFVGVTPLRRGVRATR